MSCGAFLVICIQGYLAVKGGWGCASATLKSNLIEPCCKYLELL